MTLENAKSALCAGLAAALCAVFAGTAAGAPAKKALVIMVDGLRADAVENCDMPNVRRLMEGRWRSGYRCAWSLNASTIRDSTTESAPNHVSIATGVTAAKHGVMNNADLLYGKCLYGSIRGNKLPRRSPPHMGRSAQRQAARAALVKYDNKIV